MFMFKLMTKNSYELNSSIGKIYYVTVTNAKFTYLSNYFLRCLYKLPISMNKATVFAQAGLNGNMYANIGTIIAESDNTNNTIAMMIPDPHGGFSSGTSITIAVNILILSQ